MTKQTFKNLDEMLQSESFQGFQSDTLFNIQYHIINTDKDIDAMIEANSNGEFGCTHGEFIENYREYLDTLRIFESDYDELVNDFNYDIDQQTYDLISAEIDKIEKYHLENNTYDTLI